MKIRFEIYDKQKHKLIWDDFVNRSINATFLHLRDYMDYHAGRFEDFSVLIFNHDKLIGMVPAHRLGNKIFSHQGLTYGGWLRKASSPLDRNLDIWKRLMYFFKENGIERFELKEIPLFYYRFMSETDRMVFHHFGEPVKKSAFWAIDTRKDLRKLLNRNRRRTVSSVGNIQVKPSEDWQEFWHVLQQNLSQRHDSVPVHTLEEMLLLKSRFPDRIFLFGAYQKQEMLAGAVVYFKNHVLHFQYLSALPVGINRNVVDNLFWEIVRTHYRDFAFIGMGTAEAEGKPDWNLSYWKYSFGAEPFVQYTWHFDVEKSVEEQV